MKSMSVVSSELWIGTLERWISGGLWLLDTVRFPSLACDSFLGISTIFSIVRRVRDSICDRSRGDKPVAVSFLALCDVLVRGIGSEGRGSLKIVLRRIFTL